MNIPQKYQAELTKMGQFEIVKQRWGYGMFESGDYVKVEFKDEVTGESEWMWVRIQPSDDTKRVLFGTLDNKPAVMTSLRLGVELAVSYDNGREHMKSSSFGQ